VCINIGLFSSLLIYLPSNQKAHKIIQRTGNQVNVSYYILERQ